jgi:NHL repeat
MLLIRGGATGSPAEEPRVVTFAGSGVAGISDGSPSQASFEGPSALAFDVAGNIYVADTPAQRVRIVDKNGNVKTLAGSGSPTLFGAGVAGGYQDGPASQAQFDGPSGVAVAPDGTVYVADSRNHCIRKISDGVVSTFTGTPAKAGDADGPLSAATFVNPRSIAVDRDGTIYVTDYPSRVRKISPSGMVSTLAGPWFSGATSLAIFNDRRADELFVGTPDAIGVFDVRSSLTLPAAAFITSNRSDDSWRRAGQSSAGPPSAIAAIDANEFVYADALFSTVHLVQIDRLFPWDSTEILGEQPLLNAGTRGGGFRDGNGERARYNEPTGIAVASNGTILVADAGNKAIRELGTFDRRSYTTDHSRIPASPDSRAFRVAIVGNSIIWTDESWRRSIGGVIQRRLCAGAPTSAVHCNVEIYNVALPGTTISGMSSYIAEYLSDGLVNTVVYLVPTPAGHGRKFPDSKLFGPRLEPLLGNLAYRMAQSRTQLLAVLLPGAFQMPNEDAYLKFDPSYPPLEPGGEEARYRMALAAVKRSHASFLDLWPAFFRNDAKPGFRALFRSSDHHLTDFGSELTGNAIAGALMMPNRTHLQKR